MIEMKFDGTYQSQVSEIKCSRHKHLYRPFHCIYNATNTVLTLINNENGVEGKNKVNGVRSQWKTSLTFSASVFPPCAFNCVL